MAHQYQRVIAELNCFHFGMIQGASQAKIDFAVEDHFQYLRGVSAADTDYDLRMAFLIFLEHLGKQVGADGERSGDWKSPSGDRVQLVDGLAGDGHLTQELLRMGTQRLARER